MVDFEGFLQTIYIELNVAHMCVCNWITQVMKKDVLLISSHPCSLSVSQAQDLGMPESPRACICICDQMPITVMVLAPHVVLISAAVCPVTNGHHNLP